jgi:hypothetical protein
MRLYPSTYRRKHDIQSDHLQPTSETPIGNQTRPALDGLVSSLYPILEASRSGSSARNGPSLASRAISIPLALEIEEKVEKAEVSTRNHRSDPRDGGK